MISSNDFNAGVTIEFNGDPFFYDSCSPLSVKLGFIFALSKYIFLAFDIK